LITHKEYTAKEEKTPITTKTQGNTRNLFREYLSNPMRFCKQYRINDCTYMDDATWSGEQALRYVLNIMRAVRNDDPMNFNLCFVVATKSAINTIATNSQIRRYFAHIEVYLLAHTARSLFRKAQTYKKKTLRIIIGHMIVDETHDRQPYIDNIAQKYSDEKELNAVVAKIYGKQKDNFLRTSFFQHKLPDDQSINSRFERDFKNSFTNKPPYKDINIGVCTQVIALCNTIKDRLRSDSSIESFSLVEILSFLYNIDKDALSIIRR
jgi:hypothetical protein